jgi:hypothetical protein
LAKGVGISGGLFHTTAITIILSVMLNISYLILILAFIILLIISLTTILFPFELRVTKSMITINSPIQLIDQLKGYFYINPVITLTLELYYLLLEYLI